MAHVGKQSSRRKLAEFTTTFTQRTHIDLSKPSPSFWERESFAPSDVQLGAHRRHFELNATAVIARTLRPVTILPVVAMYFLK